METECWCYQNTLSCGQTPPSNMKNLKGQSEEVSDEHYYAIHTVRNVIVFGT